MATLTIKNLPDEIYAALTQRAKNNRRSINNEAIVTLESSLQNTDPSKEVQLEEIRKIRESLPKSVWLTPEQLAGSRAELEKRLVLPTTDQENEKSSRTKKKSKKSK